MGPFWGYILTHIRTYRGCKDMLGQQVSACICVSSVDPKTRSIRGYPGPPLERVFNKTGCLHKSLYARARVGVWDWP